MLLTIILSDEPDSLTELKKMKNDPTLSSVFPATSIQTDPAINRNADRPLPKLNSRQGSASSFADLTGYYIKLIFSLDTHHNLLYIFLKTILRC